MNKIVLATGNQGKVNELSNMLAGKAIEIVPQNKFDISDAEETGTTFVENAIIKARHAAKITGLPAIADDSGLAVDYLNGAPGIYSARYAGMAATDTDNIIKLLGKLKHVSTEQRSAQFHCVLVFMKSHLDPTPVICHGIWQGQIAEHPSGSEGFGYDPIFWLPELNKTAAQLLKSEKNALSHRGQALRQLITLL